jgi:hypothetical protein
MNFYDECLLSLNEFVYEDKKLEEQELYVCLRNVFGHEVCELLKLVKI